MTEHGNRFRKEHPHTPLLTNRPREDNLFTGVNNVSVRYQTCWTIMCFGIGLIPVRELYSALRGDRTSVKAVVTG
jgi:hypothetical protein